MFARDKFRFDPLDLPDRHAMSDDQMGKAASDFLDFMRKRHTVRHYSDRAVPVEIIRNCIATAGAAPSGANHQPWHFAAISGDDIKTQIREAAEREEQDFYAGGAGEEWLKALEPIGTDASKPHLTDAPWLLVVFAQRYGEFSDGTRFKNYYVPESVGIATGFLLAALHNAGLVTLTHTPNPMSFLTELLGRPKSEKPVMIIAVGHPAENATVPSVAKIKKPLSEILSEFL